jgi:hypothetical protein
VKLIQPNLLHGPGFAVTLDDGLADKLGLGVTELGDDRDRTRR